MSIQTQGPGATPEFNPAMGGDLKDETTAKKTGGDGVVIDPSKMLERAKTDGSNTKTTAPRGPVASDPRLGKAAVSRAVRQAKQSQENIGSLPKVTKHQLTSSEGLAEIEKEESSFNLEMGTLAETIETLSMDDELSLTQKPDGTLETVETDDEKGIDTNQGKPAMKALLGKFQAALALEKTEVYTTSENNQGKTEGQNRKFSEALEQLGYSEWAEAVFDSDPELKKTFEALKDGFHGLEMKQQKESSEFTIILDAGKQKMELEKMRKSFQTDKPGAGTLEFQKLGASQNPVTKLESTVHIPTSEFEDLAADIRGKPASLQPVITAIRENIPGGSFGRRFGQSIMSEMGKIYSGPGTIDSKHQQAIAHAKSEAQSYGLDDPRGSMWDKIASALEQVDVAALKNDVQTDQVPKQMKKDDVLSSMRVLLQSAVDKGESQEKIDNLSNAIHNIQSTKGDYIAVSSVKEALTDVVSEKELSYVMKNQTFVSSSDIRMFNPGNPAVEKGVKGLEDRKFAGHPGFAFKLGTENHREVLAGKMLGVMGMNQFVMPKLEVKFEQAKLGTDLSPDGIAGKWLEDAEDLGLDRWDRVGSAKKDLEAARFRGEDTGPAEAALASAMQPFEEMGGTESVQNLALLDALFCSYDSHQLQFKHKDGQWQCFDFARFLAPSETFKRGDNVYATMRSTFLDDPRCDATMNESLVNDIKGWDIDGMEKQMQAEGLIGTVEEFQQAEQELNSIQSDSSRLSSLDETQVKEMCGKYGITVKDGDSVSDLKGRLATKFSERKEEIKSTIYKKVHPEAFEKMKGRMIALQKYVNESENPTVSGAYEKMYPQLSLFSKVLGRMESHPNLSLGIVRDQGSLRQRNLEEIIKNAESTGMASKDELAQMRAALDEYIKTSPDSSRLATTMDLS